MADRPSGADSARRCDIVVRNGYVVTMDSERRVFARGAVAIEGREIAAVGTERDILARYRAGRVYDAQGAVVHPGLIDAHLHIVHGTCRGIFGDAAASSGQEPVTFADWKADVTPDDEHVATLLAGLEMLRAGFTCFVEPGTVFDGDAVAEAADILGIRGLLAGPYLWDEVGIMKHLGGLASRSLYDRAPPDLDSCLDRLGPELHRNTNDDALVRGYVALYGLGTASDALLQAGKALADAHGVAFHQHEGYATEASEADRRRLGKSRIGHLAELGVLGANATLVHMNVVSDAEVRPLLDTGTSVVWCPVAYLNLGPAAPAGCPIPDLYRRGVNVALGLDGAIDTTIGGSASAAFFVAAGAGDRISPEAIIEMQTINAARVAGLDGRIGSLEPGKRADLVITSATAAEAYPAVNPIHQLALTCGSGTVDTVFVDGEAVVRGGRSTRVDEAYVVAQAKASVERRLARLGMSPRIEWPVLD